LMKSDSVGDSVDKRCRKSDIRVVGYSGFGIWVEVKVEEQNVRLEDFRVRIMELNRRIRLKEKLKTETEAKKIEKLYKEIDSLPDILEEIAKDDEEK
ncbi:hypothetical protein IFM89_035357, partial [Coptis chinensis]